MSEAEISALAVAAFALVISILSPWVIYRWLQNDVRVQQLKATALRVSTGGASSVEMHGEVLMYDLAPAFAIQHEGQLPVGGVEMIFEFAGKDDEFLRTVPIRVDPPIAHDRLVSSGAITISFQGQLAPKERIIVRLEYEVASATDIGSIPYGLRAWVRSESSPAVPVV